MIHTDHLCKCNNCDSILIDHNPQLNAVEKVVPVGTDELIQINENDEYFWVCPDCLTDEYLTDFS